MKFNPNYKCILVLIAICFFTRVSSQVHDKSWQKIIHDKPDEWFKSEEAKNYAQNVLLYQRDIGGWPKNVQMHHPLSDEEKQKLLEKKKTNEGATTDNEATTQELLFLSKIYRQTNDDIYKTAFLKGIDYLLEAQYDNGGWPQFYPLRKGYYTHITYNDDSMVNIMKLLKALIEDSGLYSIKPSQNQLEKIKTSFNKGIDCILKTQYRQNGVLTAWCAQHDEFTLEPANARTFELKSLSGAESAHIVLLLMSIENPSKEIINAVNSAVAWFEKTKITGLRKDRIYNGVGKIVDKRMIPDETAPAIWARFMNLEDNKPFFCDRDGIKKWKLEDIGAERRNGYAWYRSDPQMVLDAYPKWKERLKKKSLKKHKDELNITVAKDGTGDYVSIQEAINNTKSFPYDRVTILIKNGVYKEKVKIHEWNPNILLIGESKDKTIITYDDYFNKVGLGRNSTFYTYTLLVEANNVVLKNLTIENSSGEVGQAVALSVFSDEVVVVNCNIMGNQDTLYASGKGKQYYKDCYIEGTTDFIFGSATAFFENCQIHSKKNSYITAASTPKDSLFGYVFKDCKLTAEKDVNEVYLGRPWRVYAQTVFMKCDLGNHILPKGWHNWSKPEAEKTAFYAEYRNYGEGYKPKERAGWSHQLTKREAKKHTLKRVLGDKNKKDNEQWYLKIN
ncbi:pectate lyase [Winogradskyella echinorum]|uniref:Pectinesterase n=1 Tax=Winogradskyella echinorum TaxID=538189 RepID=A0ABR6XWY2_9FLAO|nr:pectate lyase [Winogradskyella echinorum]MBC3845022.1 pectate lyase [Winogradskyella echinorum]MBC5749370.1 pectate lyase [Winogradskyella echinorum]